MRSILTIKDVAQEAQLVSGRVVLCCVLVAILSIALLAKMIQLQVIEYRDFAASSEDNRVRIEPVAPIRGLIFDRNGIVLAQNVPIRSLEVIPEKVDNLDGLVHDLREIIEVSEDDEKRFRKAVQKAARFDSIPLRYRLNEDEVASFAVNRHRFPGVDVYARLSRDYPLSKIGSHLIGYVGRISKEEMKSIDHSAYRATSHIGKTGVEQAYEDVLHGSPGFQHVETNAEGRALRVLKRQDPIPGSNLYLSVDIGLQAVAERALGEENGSVVAIDPRTGQVLALVSVPTYDPNLFVEGADRSAYQDLLHSSARPLFNRALNGQYPPGSTIKPFVGLAGLERNAEHARRETLCKGYFQLPGEKRRYRGWKKGGHGIVDLKRAIVESCDIYFYELAQSLGIQRMHDFLVQFGFGQPTGIDLAGESSGLVPSPRWKRHVKGEPWYPGETLIAGIGQGYLLATPLQLASATSTLATRGLRLKPQVLLKRIEPDSFQPVEMAPDTRGTIQPAAIEHWDEIVEAMRDVVHGAAGTARRISEGIGYRMAGKTGTAQVYALAQDETYEESEVPKHLRDHGLFIAFAPVGKPEVAVAVVVENGGSGSRSAAPIARRVIDYYLNTLRIGDSVEAPMLTEKNALPTYEGNLH